MFEKAGIPVFDADAVVRRLQAPGGALVQPIAQRFPKTVENGTLNRDALAAEVLEHPESLADLEAIVHPVVHAERARFLLANRSSPALLFDIPLLFETDGEDAFDKVVVVSAPADVQRERVLARPGMTEAKFDAILSRQMPDAEKRRRADFVIDTGTDLSTTESQVREIIACLGLSPKE
jgi:dephospho-CoA kinase